MRHVKLVSATVTQDAPVDFVLESLDTLQHELGVGVIRFRDGFQQLFLLLVLGLQLVCAALQAMKQAEIEPVEVGRLRRLCNELDVPPVFLPRRVERVIVALSAMRLGAVVLENEKNCVVKCLLLIL